jgi:hypothetical protein
MSDTQIVEFYRAANGLEAQLFKVALEAADIPT